MAGAVEQNSREAAATRDAIRSEVSSWEGISVGPGPMPGSNEFRFRHKLLGHLYATWGNLAMADVMFPPSLGEALIAEGRAEPHPMFPGLGWVTYPIRQTGDCAGVVALFRKAYDGAGSHLHMV